MARSASVYAMAYPNASRRLSVSGRIRSTQVRSSGPARLARPARPTRRNTRHAVGGATLRRSSLAPVPRSVSQPVAGGTQATDRDHHGLVDQRGEQVQGFDLGRCRRGAHRVHRGEVGAAREHRQPDEQPLLALQQQPVGPVDCGDQALVPRLGGAGAAGGGSRRAVVGPPPARSSPPSAPRPARSPTAGRPACGRCRRRRPPPRGRGGIPGGPPEPPARTGQSRLRRTRSWWWVRSCSRG